MIRILSVLVVVGMLPFCARGAGEPVEEVNPLIGTVPGHGKADRS